MNRFDKLSYSSAVASVCFLLCLGLVSITTCAYALERRAERVAGTVISGDHAPVEGFACTLEDGTTVVGMHGASGVRVSVGTFTNQRVNQIRTKMGSIFVAFHQGGQDYVITDPALVLQALGYFESKRPETTQASTQEHALTTATQGEAEQQKQLEELTAQMAVLQAQDGLSIAAVNPIPEDATKNLHALILSAQESGKVRRLAF